MEIDSVYERCRKGMVWPGGGDDGGSVVVMSQRYGVARSTISQCGLMVAMAYLFYQLRLLQLVYLGLVQNPPDYAFRHMAWDETQQTFTVMLDGAYVRAAQSFQVMICRITIYWGWEGGLPASLDIVVPPVCIPTVSAVWLYYGLFFHFLTRPIHEMINKIILLARIRIQIDETDFAAGNDKLFHFLLSQNMPDIWHDLKICHSHQNHIIQGAICAIIGLELVSFIYCLSSLLRVSGYFLRMHQAVPKAVDSLLNCRHIETDGPPPICDRRYTAEVMQYILSNSDHGAINSEEKLEAGDFTDEVHTLYSISPEELLNADECKKKYLEGRGPCMRNSYC